MEKQWHLCRFKSKSQEERWQQAQSETVTIGSFEFYRTLWEYLTGQRVICLDVLISHSSWITGHEILTRWRERAAGDEDECRSMIGKSCLNQFSYRIKLLHYLVLLSKLQGTIKSWMDRWKRKRRNGKNYEGRKDGQIKERWKNRRNKIKK